MNETNWRRFFLPILIALGFLNAYGRDMGLGTLVIPLVVVLFFIFFMLFYGRHHLRKPVGLIRLLSFILLFAATIWISSRAVWLQRIPEWLLIVFTLALFTAAWFLRPRT